jgi:hypothetical protein
MWVTKLSVVTALVAATVAATAGSANAASGGGCSDATLGRSFGEVCTFTSAANPFTGWYSGDGAPAATVQLGLRVSDGRTLWLPPQAQAPNGGAVTHDWTEVPYQAGRCYTALVQISGDQAAGPTLCA